jgi:hypothetical protein
MTTTILEGTGVVMFGAPHCLLCGRPVRLSDHRRRPPRWWHCDVERRPGAWATREPAWATHEPGAGYLPAVDVEPKE